MIEDVVRIPRICVALEGREVENQSKMGEIKGKVSILIDLGSCHNYISPRIVDACKLNMSTKHKTPWLVQLATGINEGFHN